MKKFMLEHNMKPKDIAVLMETPINTVYHWLRGERRIPGIVFSWMRLHERVGKAEAHRKPLSKKAKP